MPSTTERSTSCSQRLRTALLDMMSTGRALTISEIRNRLQDYDFGDLTSEPIYRNLALLRRHGAVRRIDHAGQSRAYWAIETSPAAQLAPDDATKPGAARPTRCDRNAATRRARAGTR